MPANCASPNHEQRREAGGRNIPQRFSSEALEYEPLPESEMKRIEEKCRNEAKSLASVKSELISLIGYIDLTSLSGDETTEKVRNLCDRAVNPFPSDSAVSCAAVCVYPQRVQDVSDKMDQHPGTEVAIASVAGGFPSGQFRLESKVLEVELAVGDGATEIDIVISRAEALQGHWNTVYEEVKAMRLACGSAHLKTILAVGELKSQENVHKASMASMLAGSDFIKTSTGKEAKNANIPDSIVMCSAIAKYFQQTGIRVGFKPAGGLKTAEDALCYLGVVKEILGEDWLSPKYFRIGASSLLDDILKRIQ